MSVPVRGNASPAADSALSYSSPRGKWVLAATVLGSGMASLDATVVGIALPRIGKDFGSDVAALQWVVTGYTLTLTAFLLIGGSLGDRFGRRRVFEFGVLWFAIASAICAAAPNAGTLIAARALQGIGGALLTPGSLAILQSSFRPADRSAAIGAWSGMGGLAGAAGPLVGGYLLAVASWRWVFVINLPLALAVLVVSRRYVPESTDASAAPHIDYPGAGLAALSLTTVTYGLIEAASKGWGSTIIVGSLLVAVVSAIGFVIVERRSADPMLPLSIFDSKQFTSTNIVTFCVYGALGGTFFLMPVVLQQVAGYSPLEAGLTLLPITGLMLVASAASGRLAGRIGPRLQMSLGPLLVGGGMLLLVRLTSHHSYLAGVLPGVLVIGAGLVLTVAPLTSTAMSSAPGEHAGLASAVNNDVARAAGLFAVAVLPVATGLTGSAYLHPAVFSHGFREAAVITAILCFAGGVIAALTVSNTTRSDGPSDVVSQNCGCCPTPPLRVVATSDAA
jgi:EmrB/QacA subfamily drug resistance transporter